MMVQICVDRVDDEPDQLLVFVRNPNQAPNCKRVLDLVHGHASKPFDHGLDVGVARGRSKIEADAANPQMIRAVRSGGQIFVPSKP